MQQFEPSEEQKEIVTVMAAAGIQQDRIAACMRIDAKTLRKHFRQELDHGLDMANTEVARTLYRMAASGRHPAATIFWAKARLGWTETSKIEMTGDDGGPLKTRIEVVYTNDPTEAASLPSGPDTGPPRTKTV